MTNDRKVLWFFVIILVSAAGLGGVMYARVALFPPESKPLPIVNVPLPSGEMPSATPREKTFQSSDAVTTAVVPAWSSSKEALLIENPTIITGTTTAFESRIAWKMTDAAGRIISEGGTQVKSPDAGVPGPFHISLFYDAAPAMDRGTLHIFEASAKDGQPIHEVKIPVSFLYTAGKGNGCEARVKVAFSNTKKDPDMLDCEKTYPVDRIICGTPGAEIALHELLKGSTASEQGQGFVTNIPVGVPDPVVLPSPMYATQFDFDVSLEAGVGGSCRVGAIYAQIMNTINANIVQTGGDGVGISINGRTEDILQP